MKRENSLVPVNNLISKIDKNLKLVNKILNTVDLEGWWKNLDDNWKIAFYVSAKLSISITVFETGIQDKNENSKEDFQWQQEFVNDNISKDLYDNYSYYENISSRKLFYIVHELKCLIIGPVHIVFNLEPIKQLKYLKQLTISNTNINDLQPIYHLKSLKKLRIIKSSISKEQILKFKELNPNCEVDIEVS